MSLSHSLLLLFVSIFCLTIVVCAAPAGPGVPWDLDPSQDWLVHPENFKQKTALIQTDSTHYTLTNGLIQRDFVITPNFATVGYRNVLTGLNYYRAPKAEAQFQIIHGETYTIGGIQGMRGGEQENGALWQPWYYTFQTLGGNSYTFVNISTEPAAARFNWHPQRWSELRAWPPAGLRVNVDFAPPQNDRKVANLTVRMIYEMYDGIPVMQKYITFSNNGDGEIQQLHEAEEGEGHSHPEDEDIIHFDREVKTGPSHAHTHEHRHTHTMSKASHTPTLSASAAAELARNPHTHTHAAYAEAGILGNPAFPVPDGSAYINKVTAGAIWITNVVVEQLACPEHACNKVMTVETDYMPRLTHWDPNWTGYPFNTTVWFTDDQYRAPNTDSEWQGDGEFLLTLLKVAYPVGPDVTIPPSSSWDTFHVLELCHDSNDEERQNLGRRRWMRTLAPQGTENPIYWHLENQNNIITAIDQTVAANFEMVIISFSSGFDPESQDPAYIAFIKNATDYAHSKGILMGGYTLMQNPHYLDSGNNWQQQAFDPISGGGEGVACFATEMHRQYRQRLVNFVAATGIDLLETDGPYEGYLCGSTNHEYHRGSGDSQAAQAYFTQDFYRSLKVKDIYFTVPDPYWLSAGTNKEPTGYTDQWTRTGDLDKYERLAIGRMYSYDGSTHYPPTMSWMVFNYEDYSPLSDNAVWYELALAQYLGNGIVTCFRGQYLYDDPLTLNLTNHWATFYKAHRTVLNGDIIHVHRPDGNQVDVQLHVHPLTWPYARVATQELALGFMFNPTPQNISSVTQRLPLYYAGVAIGDKVNIEWGSTIVKPWGPVQATTSAAVDASYSITVNIKALPAYQYVYFIVTPA